MRTALVTGVLVAAAVAIIGWGRTLSNADFIYMCCGARLLSDGGLPVSGYFPLGYPALVWIIKLAGLSAIKAGALLSALGTGLSAAALAYGARRCGLAVALAASLGLLGASLPSVFEIAFNPHLDALYTGIALWLITLAYLALRGIEVRGLAVLLPVCAALLLLLRYHAVLVALPTAVLLLLSRSAVVRRAGLITLATVVIVLAGVYGMLFGATGKAETAAWKQVATGVEYRVRGPEAAPAILFEDYAGWLEQAQRPGFSDISGNIRANWPRFLARKALWLGVIVWLLALILRRRVPPQSGWLMVFIAGYTLAVSPTYFTPRASALPELAALLLLGVSLAELLPSRQADRDATPSPYRRQAALPLALAIILIALAGYNGRREAGVLQAWHNRYAALATANRQALDLAGGQRLQLLGTFDLTAWPHTPPDNLPGAAVTIGWLGDPDVPQGLTQYIPRYRTAEVLDGNVPVRAVLLWEEFGGQPGYPGELELIDGLARSPLWREVPGEVEHSRLWVRNQSD